MKYYPNTYTVIYTGRVGACFEGAYHEHRCECGSLTSGVGKSRCVPCTQKHWLTAQKEK